VLIVGFGLRSRESTNQRKTTAQTAAGWGIKREADPAILRFGCR
jgi:hypothetical protein